MCVGLFLGFLSCSIDLYFCFCASTILFWLLQLYNIVWSLGAWFLQLCFFDVLGNTIHFFRVAVGNLHSAHQRNKLPISPWPVLHFWFFHFFRMALLSDAKWHFFVVLICLALLFGWPKRAFAFFPEYIQEKTHPPFLANCIIVDVLPLFMCFKGDSNLPLDNCFLQFCFAFKSSSLS